MSSWQAEVLAFLAGEPKHVSDIAAHIKRTHQVPFRTVSHWLNEKTDAGELVRVAVATYKIRSR